MQKYYTMLKQNYTYYQVEINKMMTQRKKAILIAIEYLKETSSQNVCDFLNSGKLDTNKEN